jgi:hypothetical protein
MIFLVIRIVSGRIGNQTHFIPHGPKEIADRVPLIFPVSSETERDGFVESRVPVFPDDIRGTDLESDQSRVMRSVFGVGQEIEP